MCGIGLMFYVGLLEEYLGFSNWLSIIIFGFIGRFRGGSEFFCFIGNNFGSVLWLIGSWGRLWIFLSLFSLGR